MVLASDIVSGQSCGAVRVDEADSLVVNLDTVDVREFLAVR